jgi:2-oxoglutarate ferredoxin oxidoreductase subunit delta
MAKGEIKLNREKCKGCELCISVCPKGRLLLSKALNEKGYYPAQFEPAEGKEACTGCALCATICPDLAIEVYRD